MQGSDHWICSECEQPNDTKTRQYCISCGKERDGNDTTTRELKIHNTKKAMGVID